LQQPSLTKYASYIKEAFDEELIEHEHGFITYCFKDEGIFISNIWVDPEFRNTHIAINLAKKVEEIGKNSGCKNLLSTVCKDIKHFEASMSANLKFGLTVSHEDEDNYYLIKEI